MSTTAGPALAILVAEDNSISRDVIVRQLQLLGHAPVACEDGVEALAAWGSRRFAILFTDLQMPGLDGFALAARIRAEETGTRMPIIAMSASDLGDDALRYASAGFDDTIAKPASLDTLRRAIDKWSPPHASADAARSPDAP